MAITSLEYLKSACERHCLGGWGEGEARMAFFFLFLFTVVKASHYSASFGRMKVASYSASVIVREANERARGVTGYCTACHIFFVQLQN